MHRIQQQVFYNLLTIWLILVILWEKELKNNIFKNNVKYGSQLYIFKTGRITLRKYS